MYLQFIKRRRSKPTVEAVRFVPGSATYRRRAGQ
jgi:hypothetical protein